MIIELVMRENPLEKHDILVDFGLHPVQWQLYRAMSMHDQKGRDKRAVGLGPPITKAEAVRLRMQRTSRDPATKTTAGCLRLSTETPTRLSFVSQPLIPAALIQTGFDRRLPLSTFPSMAALVAAVHSKLLACKVPAVAPFVANNRTTCKRSNHCNVSRRAQLASFTPAKHKCSLRRTLPIVAARTESADLPLGNKVPEFQVKL